MVGENENDSDSEEEVIRSTKRRCIIAIYSESEMEI